MKNNLFKKSIALVMTVMMLMTCWVFMPATHEHFEAEAAFVNATEAYNKAKLNEINTNVDYNVDTTANYYKFKIYGNGDDGSDNTQARQRKYYKNLLSHDATTSLVGDQNRGSYFSNVTGSELTVTIAYPTMVLKYDGITTPKFGIMLEADSSSGNKIRFERAWMDANSNGLSFNPNYWMGIAKDDSAYFYCMDVNAQKYLYAQDTSNGNVFSARSNGQWEFLAASLEFTGSMSVGEWTRTISPTWKFYNGSTTYTGINNSYIYVMNFKGYGELLTQINNKKNELLSNAAQYTPESIAAFVNAAKDITNLNPKNFTGVDRAASWGIQMTNAYNSYNSAVNGLTRRQFEVTYDNMFSLADWKYSQSSELGSNVTVDLNAGKVTVKHPNSSGEYVTTHSGSSSNSGTRNTNLYAMPVVGGQEYTFKYTTDGAYTEMFAFFYDANGGCTHEGSYGAYNFAVRNGTGQATFRAPTGSTQMEIRFDNNTPNSTANFWDIMIYPAAVKTELEVDTWTNRPHRQLYNYGASVGTLQTPVRPGYIFGGWKEDTDGDGIGDAAAPTGNITSSRVLYSTWTPGTMDVGYDNLFSVSGWGNAALGKKTNQGGAITVDADNGTIAIENPANAASNDNNYTPWTYAVPVDAGKEYIFVYDTDIVGATGTQIHIFYKTSAEATSYTGFPNSPYVRAEGHTENNTIVFTPDAGTTHLSFRFGTTDGAGMTNTFSNIGLYEKADYDAYAKDYAKVREPFRIGDTKSLMNPTRAGYVFEGWELEDGTKITSVDGLTANTTVYATWTKEYTVTYYYGDNTTVLATVKVKDGETVGALPSVEPTKETNDEYEYKFAYWYADGKQFTKDTVITSDIRVYPVFNNIAHNFIWADYTVDDATCTEAAVVNRYCADCYYDLGNFTYTGDNADWLALGHEFDEDDVLRNSDQLDGNHLIKCVRYSDCDTTKKAAHTWSGNNSEGATCIIPGKIKQICPCGATQTINGALDKTNHVNQITVDVVDPDCENDGYTGDLVCDDCGTLIKEGAVDPKLGHSFTKYVSDGNATCTADGTKTAECERCDETDTIADEGSKLEHKYTNYVYNNDAKCGIDGTKTAECDTCDTNATDTITAEGTARAHEFTGAIKDNENGTHSYDCKYDDCDVYGGATACTYGVWDTTGEAQHVKTCSECKYELKENHSFSAWATTDLYKEADGQHSKTCTICSKVVTENCNYTRVETKESCTKDGFTTHTCDVCAHEYVTAGTKATGHDYTGAVKSYNNGQHNFLCKNGCNTYGFETIEGARTVCTYGYKNNSTGEHQATCTVCNYTFAEKCSGGQATCTAPAVCGKCGKAYGETVPHSFKGEAVKLDGDKHAYLCEFCGETTGIKGVGSTVDATEACSGGTATCIALAVCDKCKDTHGDYAAHVYNGTAVKLDGDVHAYRCSVCNNDALYGVGSTDNATEACSGGTATCTDLAVCTVCNDTHGELDKDAHKWGEWTNIAGTEKHNRTCEYNAEHVEEAGCFSPDIEVIAPDCETAGYTLNTCEFCDHQWQTAPTDPLGHDWSAWVNNEDGTHTRTCEDETCKYGENGGAKVETADCTKENAAAVVKAPTCTEGGYTTYTCNDCGYVWTDDATEATGHSYTEKTKKTDSKYQRSTKDCVTDWTYWYCCDNCDVSAETEKDKYENEADLYWVREAAAGHKYDAKTATEDYLATEATCTAKATYYYSCSVCGTSSKDTAQEKTFENGSALGHDWQDTETFKKSAADCVNNEVYYKECSRCHISSENETGATWEKADTKSGHSFEYVGGYTEGVAATCTEDGVVEHYTCNVCNKHFNADKTKEIAADKLTIAALKHDYEDVAAKPATCEEAGYTKHKQCQREGCGYRNTDYEVIPALGHEFKAENGYYTDTAIGYHAYKCSNCEAYGVGEVKYSAEYDGLDWIVVGGIKCEFTGEYVNYEADGVHSHKLNCVCGNEQSAACADAAPERVAPTCTEDGYYVHVCDVCSFEWIVESDAEEDEALGHDTKVVPNNNGTHSVKCQRENCDYAEAAEKCSTATPETNCGEYDVCDICKTAFGEAKPHVFTNYVYNNDAKCGADGTETATCNTCAEGTEKATDTRTAKGTALKHVMVVFEDEDSLRYKTAGVWQYNNAYGYDLSGWNGMPDNFDASRIVKPTCKNDGLAISYCTREDCSYYLTMVAARVDDGHEWGEEKSIGGNCATGVTFRKECINCGTATTRVETVDHTYVLRALEPANCTSEEIRYSVCSVCGDENEERIGEKLGHDWATDVIEKEATCAQTGRKYSICSRCNAASEKTEIPRLGHVWEEEGFNYAEYLEKNPNANILYVEASEATCEFEGYNGYYKCFSCSYDQHFDEEWRKENIIEKKGHEDNDGDSKCDECNDKIYGEDKDSACGCICHKENWFSNLIYKILCFFWKLFGIGKSCECGTVHY